MSLLHLWRIQRMKGFRKAHLILHRKQWSTKYCICGSVMVPEKDWTCKRMVRLGEPKAIEVWVPKNKVIEVYAR